MRRPSRALARRYARALLDVATAPGGKTAAPELAGELEAAAGLLGAHAELAAVLGHPALSLDKKKKIAAAVWAGKKPSELFRRLLDLLLARDRIDLLPEIAAVFRELESAARGVIAAEAVTATPLDPGQAKALALALGRLSGLEIALERSVDASVLGGVLVRMGGKTYDGTVRTRLRALRERLAGA